LGYSMSFRKHTVCCTAIIIGQLSGCGGTVGGDADDFTERTLFAVGDIFETVEDGGPVEGDVSTNDQGNNLSFALSPDSVMSHGDLIFNSDGSFIYTPSKDFFGQDSVTYVATDTVSGESDSARLTIDVINDFETLEEYGWQLVWSDEFNADTVDASLWQVDGGSLSSGSLVLQAEKGSVASIRSLNSLRYGRVQATMKAPVGTDLVAMFGLLPAADMYDGDNSLSAFESDDGTLIAAAHYGLGLTSGVMMNTETIETASEDFHTYAIEWGEGEIRWYIDDDHVHTVNTLNTWAYNLSGDDVVADNSGPYNQDMHLVFDLAVGVDGAAASIVVDQVKVWTCDTSITSTVENCASNEKSKVSRQASDRIETVGPVEVELFSGGYFDAVSGIKISDLHPFSWHYTDEIIEPNLKTTGTIDVDVATVEQSATQVLDVTSGSGVTSFSIEVPEVELIGLGTVLNFDLYIHSGVSSAEALEVRMASGIGGGGYKRWLLDDLVLDSWNTLSVSVNELLSNPVVIDGVSMPLDVAAVTSMMTLEVTGSAHLLVNNINLTCINSESCVQGPLGLQSEAAPKAEPIRYEAEDYIAESGTGLEDTTDEGGGQNIAFLNAGDYLVYSISAPGIGPYSIDYRVASAGGSDGFEVSIDGVVVDRQTIPDTGDWQNWTTLTSDQFDLVVGVYTLQIDFLDDGQNLNWFELQPPVTEIFIEAEDYDNESGISLEDTTDEGGGQNIGYIDEGDFVEYTVNIPSDGTYLIEYRLASAVDSFGFTTSIGGSVVDTQTLLSTGGWQNWITQSAEVELVAGEQMMRLDFLGGAINVNWIRLTRK